jgi:hypothetical protein
VCRLFVFEEKNDVGGLKFEFVLDLNGSRIPDAAGIED